MPAAENETVIHRKKEPDVKFPSETIMLLETFS